MIDETHAASDPLPEAAEAAREKVLQPEGDSALEASGTPEAQGSEVASQQPVSDEPAEVSADEATAEVASPQAPEPEPVEEAAVETSPAESVGADASVEATQPVSADAGGQAYAEEEDVEDEEEEEEEEIDMNVEPLEQIDETADEDLTRDWYILKVQSNREESIRDGLQRRVAVAGLDRFFGEIIVPTEDVAEFKNGKKRISKRKLYPGYIVVHMAINDDTWFLVRETPGIGDFTGSAGRPSPMLPHEVERIVQATKTEEDGGEPVKTAIPFKIGDRARIKEGTFENFEGEVDSIDEANGHVTVMINIFGRSTPVELEHWQIEAV